MPKNPEITPEARERAYKSAIEHAKQLLPDLVNVPSFNFEEVIKDIVSEALIALDEPAHEEPPNNTLVKGFWEDGTIDVYERIDDQAPSSEGLIRPWKSYSKSVWLPWNLVLEILEEKGPGGEAKYEIYLPFTPVKPKPESQTVEVPLPPAKGGKS